ncbi:villin headpiece domain-containing protein [Ditylenchus destructor]|uniref:Villin headpiece domain-containing protein n=1 Tax=Ditylenchus destructor TaxID=166010 RepID=A0AAD4NH66_9BILA|nr:villin headpiece domain-containing protein [Ditylenchus destructor]
MSTRLADRLKALQENQESWRNRVDKPPIVLDIPSSGKKSLEFRRSELFQASDDWRKRLRTETESIEPFNKGNRSAIRFRPTAPLDISEIIERQCKGECVRPKRQAIAENSSLRKESANLEGDDNTNKLLVTPRRSMPGGGRRLPTRLTPKSPEITESATPDTVILTEQRVHFELGKEYDQPKRPSATTLVTQSDQTPRSARPFKAPANAFQTPIIGQDHCGVKLREVDWTSPFPDVMLIRVRGFRSSELSVRLICPRQPKFAQSAVVGSYLLITKKRLIISNSDDSTVAERAKVSQMAYEILAGKEMGCGALRIEIANDDPAIAAAFYRSIECDLSSIKNEDSEDGKSSDAVDFREDAVYSVTNEEEIELISKGQAPRLNIFDSSTILVFDFVTELYVWVGRDANRSCLKNALAKANDLKGQLPSTPCPLLGSYVSDKRPEWIVFRKFTEGIVDCLFRHKFPEWQSICTPTRPIPKSRPWSMPICRLAKENRSSRTHRSTAMRCLSTGAEEALSLKDEHEVAEELATTLINDATKQDQFPLPLQLEGVELRHTDDNVFTEGVEYFGLLGDSLCKLNDLNELDDQNCYVIKWHYRIERKGVRRLVSTPVTPHHETGRQRVVFFYWLGARSSIKDQSRCALALRDYDKERHEHVRVEQGQEPAILLNLFDGKMIVSGASSGWFLVTGCADNRLANARELHQPLGFRTQTTYIHVSSKEVTLWKGMDCSDYAIQCGQKIATHLSLIRKLPFVNPSMPKLMDEQDPKPLRAKNWIQAPRLTRIYATEGYVLTSLRYHPEANFCFRQSDLRVANFLIAKKGIHTEATVICQGREPDEFKALFPDWIEWSSRDSTESPIIEPPRSLAELFHERTRSRTMEELQQRDLPRGCDTRNLERYLTDQDFEQTFGYTKEGYSALPAWKQISLKKKVNLF